MTILSSSKFKIGLKVFEWVVFVILLFILAVVASPLLPTKDIASFYVVVSGSMEPVIPTGSLIMVKSVDNKQLKVDDIIAFTSPTDSKQTITHRIAEVTKNGDSVQYLTKGDNNNSMDNWTVSSEAVKGQYQVGLPWIGFAIEWIKTPVGFIVAVGIPAILFLILQIRKIKQGINEEVEKRTQKALQNQSAKTEPDRDSKIVSITIALLLTTTILASTIGSAQALFSSRVQINGITLEVADDGSHSPFPCGVIVSRIHWYKVKGIYRIIWIELRNINHHSANIGHWKFNQSWRQRAIELPQDATIPANDTFVITNSEASIDPMETQAKSDLALPLNEIDIVPTDTTAFVLNQSDGQTADILPQPETSNWNNNHFHQYAKWHFPFTRGWWNRPILICGWWNPIPFPTMPPMPTMPTMPLMPTFSPGFPFTTPTPTPTSSITPTPSPTPSPVSQE